MSRYDDLIVLAEAVEQNAASSSQDANSAESNAEIALDAAQSSAASAQTAGASAAGAAATANAVVTGVVTQAVASGTAAALAAKTGAETAKAGAENARLGSETARDLSVIARVAAETARQQAQDAILADLGTSDGQLTALDANANSGFRKQQDARAAAVTPYVTIAQKLALAKDRVVTGYFMGTSVSSFDNGPTLVFAQYLADIYGDSGISRYHLGGAGGSYTGAFSGWSRETYAGSTALRLKGQAPTATPISVASGIGNQFVVEYSTETDGGVVSFYDNQINAGGARTLIGTIDCQGAQKFRNIATFNLTGLVHRIEMEAPTTGFGRVEYTYLRDTTSVGIHAINSTFGGKGMKDHMATAAAGSGQVAGPAVVGFNGLEQALRSDIDFIFCSHLINDSPVLADRSDPLSQGVTYLCSESKIRGIPVVLVVEPGGNNKALPLTNLGRQNWESKRALLLEMDRDNPHVTTIDWDQAAAITPYSKYAALYYPGVTGVNDTTGSYTGGDYIHGNNDLAAIGLAELSRKLGFPMPKGRLQTDIYHNRAYNAPAPVTPAEVSPFDGPLIGGAFTPTRKRLDPRGMAFSYPNVAVNRREAWYVDDTAVDQFSFNTRVAASSTSDSYGPYVDLNNEFLVETGMSEGLSGPNERVKVLALVDGRVQTVIKVPHAVTTNISTLYYKGARLTTDGSVNTIIVVPGGHKGPIAITFEYAPGEGNGGGVLTPTGRFYGLSATRMGPDNLPVAPVLTRGRRPNLPDFWRVIGPELRLEQDPTFDADLLGQRYYEILAETGVTMHKRLVSKARRFNWATASYDREVGLYEALDRTAASIWVARLTGAKDLAGTISGTTAATKSTGFGGEITSNGVAQHFFAGMGAYTEGALRQLVMRRQDSASQFLISLENPSNGTRRHLAGDGVTWQNIGNPSASSGPGTASQPIVVQFAMPTGQLAVDVGQNPNLIVRWFETNSPTRPHAAVVLARGRHACI